MRRLLTLGFVATLAVALAACSSGSSNNNNSSSSSSGSGGTVTISNESGTLWTCGFNPYNPSTIALSVGTVYETLDFVSTLQNQKVTPWLASAYHWSNGNKTITFTIRPNVKWQDGKPLTAADVVYTFNLLKAHNALDLNAVWSVLSSVTESGSNQVVMNFKTEAVPYFYYIADQVPIVPQHIWSKIANPVTYNDPSPVGTGPFKVGQCTAQNISYVKNPNYWQPGLPKISKVEYPAFTSNDPANTYLATGQAQWGSQFIPNIQAFYMSKSQYHHYWFPPVANVSLFINQTVPLLNNVKVRQAMAFAINRDKVSQIGEYGYEPPSNQNGVVLPTFQSWFDASAAAKYNYSYDPAKAEQILQSAGFKKGSNGIYQSPSGQPLSFSVINIGGYSDWVASLQVVASELKAVGINVNVDNLSQTDFNDELYNGHFQLAYNAETGGPAPYYELRQWLYGPNSAPIGQSAGSNWERYMNPQVDKLINQYGATTSHATQLSIVYQLQEAMLRDVPVIPMTEEVDWYQYNTQNLTGWATPSDPFALPAAYQYPDIGVMLLHLKSK